MDGIKHLPELIVIAGPNGSGKTTVTTQFLHHKWSEGVMYINPDQVAEDKFGGWNNPDAAGRSGIAPGASLQFGGLP